MLYKVNLALVVLLTIESHFKKLILRLHATAQIAESFWGLSAQMPLNTQQDRQVLI